MTMKRKIFISNTAMVLISLLILFGIGGAGLMLFKDEILGVMKQNAEQPENMYEVETLLKNTGTAPDKWQTLSDELAAYDFTLYVADADNKRIYTNTRHGAMECIEELEKDPMDSANPGKSRVYCIEEAAIARTAMSDAAGQMYNVYAVYYRGERSLLGLGRGIFEMFIIVFIIAGMIIIAGLLLCSQLFTKLMIKNIMKPVDELSAAAQRIDSGNLDEPINYTHHDEFSHVCDTFNTMQQHLKEGIEKTQKYEQARTEMVSGISHDLKTPLTSVKGYIKGMLDGVANTPEKQRQYLEISYRKACDMDRLLQKLFFFSKLETGNMPFSPQPVQMDSWLSHYADEKKTEGKDKGYVINYIPEAGLCESVKADEPDTQVKIQTDEVTGNQMTDIRNQDTRVSIDIEQTRRVFDNLIENSVKYADADSLEIDIRTHYTDDGHIEIDIHDNGQGIEAEKLPHVFEQFYRGDESRTSKNDGSGLGLYVCKYIIEQQGGSIKAYSKDGFGVKIVLPTEETK